MIPKRRGRGWSPRPARRPAPATSPRRSGSRPGWPPWPSRSAAPARPRSRGCRGGRRGSHASSPSPPWAPTTRRSPARSATSPPPGATTPLTRLSASAPDAMAKTWQVVLATVAIFLAGLVTGGALALGAVRWSTRHPRINPAQMFPFGQQRQGAWQPAQVGPQLMRGFISQLDLTDEQRAKIQSIVRRAAGQLARERREVQLNSALLIEKMQDEIAQG